MLQGLINALERASTIESALAQANRDADFSLPEGLNAPLLAGLLDRRATERGAQAAFVITATSREAEALEASIAAYAPGATVLDFPAWETLPHERLSPSAEIVGRRIEALRTLREWSEADAATRAPLIVVASVRAALQPIADNLADRPAVVLAQGGRGYDLSALAGELVDLAYTRVDMVTRRGEFAVRGGILDVFPPVADHAYRVDFFGDEIDQLRAFSVADQRSLPEPVASVSLMPSREM